VANNKLEELSQAVAAVVAAAAPSVVGVGRAGSGIVVADGLVLTNAHNLRDRVVIAFDDGQRAEAEVAGADTDGDLAVLAVPTEGRPALSWAEAEPALGQVVIGLSRPAGRSLRAGVGFVSGLGLAFRGPQGATITGALEHSAPLARGSSGGPLLGPDGRMFGVNTHREGEGLYLAIPATAELRARVDALARGEVPERRRLGVALAPPGAARHLRQAVGLPPRDGLLVRGVDPEGPAARAGVRTGDLLVSADGRALSSVEDLSEALKGSGESLSLIVVRGVDEVTIKVTFEPGPSSATEAGNA
jgi:serine protease Do